MSLVAYGSSDESENEDEIIEQSQVAEQTQNVPTKTLNINSTLQLPIPKVEQSNDFIDDDVNNVNEQRLNFDAIPKPKSSKIVTKNGFEQTDNVSLHKKVSYEHIEKPLKKEKGPIKITIPSLTNFKDVEEDIEQNRVKRQPSQKASGLISILPPPKCSPITTKTNIMVPHVLTKAPVESKKLIAATVSKKVENSIIQKKSAAPTLNSLSNYKSDSEDEDEKGPQSEIDFFSLSASTITPDELVPSNIKNEIEAITALDSSTESNEVEEKTSKEENKTNKVLTSNIINLPKEDILLKNKAEVGPKLPIPEQEYNVDSEGNVAFDEKAIEYLCGKRGVKRKNELSNVDIIEINGEDIKPDEREWMIKALTDEAAQRPVSVGAGPSGQSKKKHQITYLAHQAKAMELELKNQWAQNKASRQQTRSKYGF